MARFRSGPVRPSAVRLGVEPVLGLERSVHLHEGSLLGFGEAGLVPDRPGQVAAVGPFLEDAGLDVQGFGRYAQGLGQLLQDLGRGLAQASLDLAEVGVGDLRHVGQLPQRQAGDAPLLADEVPEGVGPVGEVVHASSSMAGAQASRPSTDASPVL
jgi:hypothetical protein